MGFFPAVPRNNEICGIRRNAVPDIFTRIVGGSPAERSKLCLPSVPVLHSPFLFPYPSSSAPVPRSLLLLRHLSLLFLPLHPFLTQISSSSQLSLSFYFLPFLHFFLFILQFVPPVQCFSPFRPVFSSCLPSFSTVSLSLMLITFPSYLSLLVLLSSLFLPALSSFLPS